VRDGLGESVSWEGSRERGGERRRKEEDALCN